MNEIKNLEQEFREYYRAEAEVIVRAPGRVELIGGHTDYNDGYVLPMAIERKCMILARRRTDRKVKIYSCHFKQETEFDLDPAVGRSQIGWSNYGRGVAALLLQAGKKLVGLDMYLSCDIPVGGGLSSSAAIEVAYAKTFLAATGEKLSDTDLALLCQKAEHDFAGAPCGIMDQFICVLGKASHALLLDCRTQKFEHIPVPQVSVLIADTKVKHDLGQSGYPLRRRQCYEAVEIIGKKALRDVDMNLLEKFKVKLDAVHYARAKHIIGENERVIKMANGFRNNDLKAAGQAMNESHNSLRDDYEVSCEELDFLVDQARLCKGVYGARMSGGGFGGCIVALVENNSSEKVAESLKAAYEKKYKKAPAIFITGASSGASYIMNKIQQEPDSHSTNK